MSTPLFVSARFHSKKEKIAEMKSLLYQLTSETLQNEKGCISYVYLQDIQDETLFTSNEIWQNADSENKHWEMDHLKRALEKLPELLEGEVEVKKWNRI